MPEADAVQDTAVEAGRTVTPAQQENPETVQSTGDERTVNNVMRHEYRVLNEKEKRLMQAIKDEGLAFYKLIEETGLQTSKGSHSNMTRELSIAKTKIEEAVMWAVKHITA